MEGQRRSFSCLWWAGSGLIGYCVLLTAFAGDLGFDADDWWIFSWPFWHSFPQSIVYYAQEALRPVEGLYWISLFEIFGFNKPAFHLFSLLLLASSSIVMGTCLDRAFPDSRVFVVTAVSFFVFLANCFVSHICHNDGQFTSELTLLLAFRIGISGLDGKIRSVEVPSSSDIRLCFIFPYV